MRHLFRVVSENAEGVRHSAFTLVNDQQTSKSFPKKLYRQLNRPDQEN